MSSSPNNSTPLLEYLSSLFSFFRFRTEKEYFIENLATLLSSGMGVSSSIQSLKGEMRSYRMRKVLQTLEKEIEAGSPLWLALQHTKLVPSYTITLIRLGEKSGQLSKNLDVIVKQREKNRLFYSQLQIAITYPLFVLCLTLVVGISVAWFILPRLSSVFDDLNLKLPIITRVLIIVGQFLQQWGIVAVPLFFVFVGLFIYFIFFFQKTKRIGETMLFMLPSIKKLIRSVELARMGYMLGNLLETGLPVTAAIGTIASIKNFSQYQKLYLHLQKSIEEGNSFKKSFQSFPNSVKLIPTSVQQIIIAGEQSGRLSEALIKIGTIYENKSETTTKGLGVILEPVLLFIIWIGVVMVALAIILPIYSLIGGLSENEISDASSTPAPIASPR